LVGSLESQVKQRTAQLSASAEVGRAVSSILDVPTLLSAVVNLISDRFGYYYTAVFMLDESGQYAVLQEATGEAGRVLKEHGHRLEARETSMVGSAISTGRPRIALHAETEATRFVNPLLPDTRSEIALPLRLGGRVIGALDVQSVQPNAFDEASASVLQSMADAIAVSLGNARLYTEVQQRAKQQEGLARIAALSGSTLTVDELLNQLMAEARQLLGAEITVALLKDEARQALVGRHIAGEGAPTPAAETWFVPLNAPGFEQGIFARGGNYYSNKAPDDPNIIPAYRPYMEALQVRNFCGVALRVRDQSLGELYVANRASGFGRNDIALLQTIAGYAANAIQNARLFEETQRLAVREQMINAMTARIRSGLTLEDALQATVQEVGQRLSAGRVAVRLKLAQEPSSRGNGHGNETS
jgi:GAF domain-containing protein